MLSANVYAATAAVVRVPEEAELDDLFAALVEEWSVATASSPGVA